MQRCPTNVRAKEYALSFVRGQDDIHGGRQGFASVPRHNPRHRYRTKGTSHFSKTDLIDLTPQNLLLVLCE